MTDESLQALYGQLVSQLRHQAISMAEATTARGTRRVRRQAAWRRLLPVAG
jgi:hypothetical protein